MIDEHVEAAAVRHAEHHVVHAVGAAAVDELVKQRNQTVAAFEREAFLADIFRVQIALETFGLREQLQRAFLLPR